MNLREAAQQAIDALEKYQEKGAPFMECDAAVAALRAALAENVPETNFGNMAQEVDCYGDGNVYRGQRSSDSKTPTLTINGMLAVEGPLSKAHRTSQEFRQVEPAAFINRDCAHRMREVLTQADFNGDKSEFLKYCMADINLLPLYTAPPKRKPISTDMILATWVEECIPKRSTPELVVAFARAIERAHGIGGEE